MSVLIKHMAMPKGCIYANDKDQTEYCPLLNHDDVPFCQYIENEPEIAIGIDERPVYCPLSDVPEPCKDAVSRQAAIDAFEGELYSLLLFEKIQNLPSAQPERQKGEWIDHTEDGYVECPFCHSATNCDGNKDELHFCFSCGADMRGKQDG